MVSHGWVFDMEYDGSVESGRYRNVGDKGCDSTTNWYGWSGGSSDGTLSAVLYGNGEVNMDFGNCWNRGNVKVYLDSVLLATSPKEIKSVVKSFSFTHGSLLEIKEEDGAVITLNSISISCFGKNGKKLYLKVSNFNL